MRNVETLKIQDFRAFCTQVLLLSHTLTARSEAIGAVLLQNHHLLLFLICGNCRSKTRGFFSCSDHCCRFGKHFSTNSFTIVTQISAPVQARRFGLRSQFMSLVQVLIVLPLLCSVSPQKNLEHLLSVVCHGLCQNFPDVLIAAISTRGPE